MKDIMINSIRMLLRKKGRTLLTLFGIIVGVASVIIINNISECGSSALTEELDELGMGGLSIAPNTQNVPFAQQELKEIQELYFVDFAMPLMFESTDVYVHNDKCPAFLWGIDDNAKNVINLSLIQGRFLNAGDISSVSDNCMIDQTLAMSCYGSDNVIGKRIIINNGGTSAQYTIVGVIKTGSGILQNMMGNYIPNFVYLPYTTMQRNMNTDNYSQIEIKVKQGYDDNIAADNVVRTIERNTDTSGAYTLTNLAAQKESLRNIIDIFTVVLTLVGVISLFVAGLSIMNVMLAAVTERRREIGIKKALGASKSDIVIEFLMEAVILTLVGGIAGILLGMLISWAGALSLGLTLVPRIDIIIIVLLFSVFIGIIFGIYPAFKAASTTPVSSLRSA